jgi:tellurite resistance protein
MRIAMIDPSLLTLPYDELLCEALVERGNSVTLFTRPLREGEPRPQVEYERTECFFLDAEDSRLNRLPSPAKKLLKGVERSVEMASLLRDLRHHQPDVIHFQGVPAPMLERFSLPMVQKIAPIVLTVHDIQSFLERASQSQVTDSGKLLRAFDRVVVRSDEVKAELIEVGAAREQVVVISQGESIVTESAGVAEGGSQFFWEAIADRLEQTYASVVEARNEESPDDGIPDATERTLSAEEAHPEEPESYDPRPVRWKELLSDAQTARDIGELSLFVAFADGKLEAAEREVIVDALAEMELPVEERRLHARELFISMLENLNLTRENFVIVGGRLSNKLDDTQKEFLVEVLFLVAISDGVLHARERDVLKDIASTLDIPGNKVQLLIDGFRSC